VSARFEITHQRPGADGAREILRRQIEAALEGLAGRTPSDHGIHAVRKHIKAARGTLRLLRPAAGERAYRSENRTLRDAGRLLSAARDGPVLVRSLERLQPKILNRAAQRRVAGFGARLRESAARQRRATRLRHIPHARTLLRAALARLASWPALDGRWESPRRGLLDTYRKARAAAQANARGATSESLHEWRKQSKYLRTQLQLISPVQHASVTALSAALHELTDELGEDHDLAVLSAMADARLDANAASALQRLIAKRRKKLQRAALAAGRRLYRQKPHDFDRRLRHYFYCWSA
jgi:CHAD domain-containing protein